MQRSRTWTSYKENLRRLSDRLVEAQRPKTGEEGEWYKVELPDGRNGFLRKSSVMDYQAWRRSRQTTADNIERSIVMVGSLNGFFQAGTGSLTAGGEGTASSSGW